jgi:hypothetical protein
MLVCEALGPTRFAGWDHDGRPLGAPVRAPFIPVVATEEGQAGHVYQAVEFMLREGAVSATPGLDVGLTRTFLLGGGKIQPVTAKASSKEGGRGSFAAVDESHLFILPELHHLHETIRRNLVKRKTAQPWSLEVSTMYSPGEGSVAEQSHAYAQAIAAGKINDRGFLFDHRSGPAEFDFADDEQLRAAPVEAYGQAAEWMDVDRMIAEARDPMTDESDFMRYFVNVPSKREGVQFVKASVWNALADPELEIAEGAQVCVGADGFTTCSRSPTIRVTSSARSSWSSAGSRTDSSSRSSSPHGTCATPCRPSTGSFTRARCATTATRCSPPTWPTTASSAATETRSAG